MTRTVTRPTEHVSRRSFLKTGMLTSGALALGGAMTPGTASATRPVVVSSSNVEPVHLFVRPKGTADQEPTAPMPSVYPNDVLEERREGNPVDAGTDTTTVDGEYDQLTWAQFSAVEGHVTVTKIREGTHVTMEFENLVPGAVYTGWNVVFERPGASSSRNLDEADKNLAGFGPLGPPDGSENTFTPDADGYAQLSTITPGGELGAVGTIEDWALDEFEWHVIAGFHLDGQTHGAYFDDPAEETSGTAVEHAAFVFKEGEPA